MTKAQEMLELAAECKKAAAELNYMGSVPQLLVRCEIALRFAARAPVQPQADWNFGDTKPGQLSGPSTKD